MKTNALNPFSSIGAKEVVGIDLSGNNLKIAHLKLYPSKKEVAGLVHRDIAGLADNDVAKIVATCLDDLKLKNWNVVQVITAQSVITKDIEIPSTDPREIREIVNLQAGRHTPYAREEIIVDYIDIDTYKRSYTKILLIIVARSVIKRQVDILTKAGVGLERIVFAPEGMAWCASRILKLDTAQAPMSIAHIDSDSTDFSVIFKGKAVFIRNIPIGSRLLAEEREQFSGRFAEELAKSVEAYQNENIGKNPAALVLTGCVEGLENLEAVLSAAAHLPVKTIPYLKNIAVSKDAPNIPHLLRRMSFLNVIAPLLALEHMKVDLTPEEMKLRKALEEHGRDLMMTGVYALSALVLVFALLICKIYFKSAYLGRLKAQYQPLNQEAVKLEKDFVKISMIKKHLMERGFALDVLAEIHAALPLEMQLEDIRYDQQGKFAAKGTAESMSTVFAFVDNLGKSKYFKEVKTKYTSQRKDGQRDVTDFEITAQLNRQEK